MIGTEKHYTLLLRAEANADLADEAKTLRAPGHMTMRAVTELEHKRDRGNETRWVLAVLLLLFSYIVTGPFWLDRLMGWVGLTATLFWLGMTFYTWRQTKRRVLPVLENHRFLQTEAAAERH